jgi:hypothetical protein
MPENLKGAAAQPGQERGAGEGKGPLVISNIGEPVLIAGILALHYGKKGGLQFL